MPESGRGVVFSFEPPRGQPVLPASPWTRVLDAIRPPRRRARAVERAAHGYLIRLLDVNGSRLENDFVERLRDSRHRIEQAVPARLRALSTDARRVLEQTERRPLSSALVELFRSKNLAGATVLRGVAGFGPRSILHTAGILKLSADLPLIIEVVDSQEHLDAVLPEVDRMMSGGLITMEKVRVLRYEA